MRGNQTVKDLTGDELVFLCKSYSDGLSLTFSGATGGSVKMMKQIDGHGLVNLTDDDGVPLVVNVFPLTRNIEPGMGAEIHVQADSIIGTLIVTALPLRVR